MTQSPQQRVRIGEVWIDAVTFAQALDRIEALVARGEGGSVFTPNIDHVVNVDRVPKLKAAYDACSLSLVDGQPLLWAARLLGTPLPEKISGSDLTGPLLDRAAKNGHRVYLLGAMPDVAEDARKLLVSRGVNVVGIDPARVPMEASPEDDAILARITAARPDLMLVALGSPKQELFIHRASARLRPTVSLGIGASLDFLTGRVKRAPVVLQRAGLEWLYRLASEPRRLWRRYLVNDPRFALILARSLRVPRTERVRDAGTGA